MYQCRTADGLYRLTGIWQITLTQISWSNQYSDTVKSYYKMVISPEIWLNLCHVMAMTWSFSPKYSGPWFNIKMPPYQYIKSHCEDKMVIRFHITHLSYPSFVTFLLNAIQYHGILDIIIKFCIFSRVAYVVFQTKLCQNSLAWHFYLWWDTSSLSSMMLLILLEISLTTVGFHCLAIDPQPHALDGMAMNI